MRGRKREKERNRITDGEDIGYRQREERLARGNLVVKRASQQLRINWNVVEGGGQEEGKGEIRGGLEPIEDGAPGNWNETERGSMALSMFRSVRCVPTVFSPAE